MTRFRFNRQLDPPASFVLRTLFDIEGSGRLESIPAQVDSGADCTIVPNSMIERLRVEPVGKRQLAGFGGGVVTVFEYFVGIQHPEKDELAIKVMGADEPWVLLGRDVLNHYRFLYDGPRLVVEIE